LKPRSGNVAGRYRNDKNAARAKRFEKASRHQAPDDFPDR
jgi:hypothetical protein